MQANYDEILTFIEEISDYWRQELHDFRYLLWCGFHLSMQSAVSAYFLGFPALCLFIFAHKKRKFTKN
jgi:hypothetical protein